MKKRIMKSLALVMTAGLLITACSSSGESGTAGSVASTSGDAASAGQESTGAASNSPYDQGDTIKFGIVAAKSGANAAAGNYMYESARLAVKHINEAGGILGKQVELIEEDEGETQQESVNAVLKLLSRGDISAYYQGYISTNVIAVSEIDREYKIPHVTGGASMGVVEDNNPYQWHYRQTDDLSGPWYASTLVEMFDIKNPCIVHKTDTYGQGLADSAVAAFKEMYDITIDDIFTFNIGEKQFTPIVTQIANSGNDALMYFGDPNEAALLMSSVKSMGLDIFCIGSASVAMADTIAIAGDAAEGWYSCADWTIDVDTPEAQKFREDYVAEYGHEPTIPGPYDGFRIVAEAIERAGSADPAAINEEMANTKDYPGVTSIMTPNEHHSMAVSRYLTQNTDGVAKIVETIDRPEQ